MTSRKSTAKAKMDIMAEPPAQKRRKVARKKQEVEDDGGCWELKTITDCRLNPTTQKTEYKVSWSGTDPKGKPWSPTWEEEANLTNCSIALANFNLARNGAKNPAAKMDDNMSRLAAAFVGCSITTKPLPSTVKGEQRVALVVKSGVILAKYKESQKRLAAAEAFFAKQIARLNANPNNKRKETGYIWVENTEDFEYPPTDFEYITDYDFSALGFLPEKMIVGCDCKKQQTECGGGKRCCPGLAYSSFEYDPLAPRLKVPRPGRAIFECNSACACGPECANRVAQRGRSVEVCIFRTFEGERGWGLKTCENLKKGQFVMLYIGEVIPSKTATKRGKKYDQVGETYLFDLDFNNPGHGKYTVDARLKGNVARFINHSCSPNLLTYNVWIENLDADMPYLALFAGKDIRADTELTFDYTMDPVLHEDDQESADEEDNDDDDYDDEDEEEDDDHQKVPIVGSSDKVKGQRCFCGAKSCRGYVYKQIAK